MEQKTYHLMEQLIEAANSARSSRRNMYVFLEDGKWWFSGQVPESATDFYVAYPSGQIDGAGNAPNIGPTDWNEFFEMSGETFKPPVIPVSKKIKAERRFQVTQKKIFVGYSAFAPYIAMAMAMCFSRLFESSLNMPLLFMSIIVTIPLSVVFVLVSLFRPKDPKTAMLAAMLALDAHTMFYGHLVYLHSTNAQNLMPFVFTTMVSMGFSGIALLLIWDNERTAKPSILKDVIEA